MDATAETNELIVDDTAAQTLSHDAIEALKALGSRDEAYNLTVPATGADATLVAKTTLGLLRGLTTFEQLWFTLGNATYTPSAPFAIQDAPAFVRGAGNVTRRALEG